MVDQSWERIGVTGNHPIWSQDRHDYVAAMDLRIGERLKNLSGDTVWVQQKLPRPGPTPVYNLEVQDEHVYYVGASGVLAHNSTSCDANGAATERNIVYRALSRDDADALAAGHGLRAKAPSGTWTAAEHVANQPLTSGTLGGSAVNSPWLSTTKRLDVARAYDSGYGIIAIDLNMVGSFQTEVWRHAPRVNGVRGLAYHRSFWAEEVTIFQEIPFSAIIGPVKR